MSVENVTAFVLGGPATCALPRFSPAQGFPSHSCCPNKDDSIVNEPQRRRRNCRLLKTGSLICTVGGCRGDDESDLEDKRKSCLAPLPEGDMASWLYFGVPCKRVRKVGIQILEITLLAEERIAAESPPVPDSVNVLGS